MARARYYATTRQFTGTPNVFRAYVYDREIGRPLEACPHLHRSRTLNKWDVNGRKHVSGNVYADRCAKKMLRRILARIAA